MSELGSSSLESGLKLERTLHSNQHSQARAAAGVHGVHGILAKPDLAVHQVRTNR